MLRVTDPILTRIVPRLAKVPGIVGVVLGGSRARGTANPASDYDIGLYYGPDVPLDTEHLLKVVRDLVDDADAAAITPVGGWGPRIVGGGWLSIEGRKVDLLYRGVDPVRAVISDCRAGQISMDYQSGHPHGFCSAIWMGEVALCQPLHDPQGLIIELKASTSPYPDKLREALLKKFLPEILFSIENGEIAIARGEQTHIAGCVYRALCCIGQVLFALNRRYLINEKGALAEAAKFSCTIPDLSDRTRYVWAAIGSSELAVALSELRALDGELRALAVTAA
jgi:predicted nucleotidyltransferase